MDIQKLQRDVNRLLRDCNSMQCPDCGGLHQVRFRALPDGTISEPCFEMGIFGAPCWGYKHFVTDSINNLQKRYNIGD